MKYYYSFILTLLMLSTSLANLASSQDQSGSSWGVVYNSEKEIQQAKQKIDQLPRLLPQYRNQNFLFKRRQWYTNVVVFSSKLDAKNSLPIIENKYSQGSFVVNLQEWCRPDWRKNEGTKEGINFYDCKRGEIIETRSGAVIINKFSNLKDALSDQEKLKNTFQQQQHNLTIFKRGDSYFTAVINYANKNGANQKKPNNFRGAYAVDLNQWCPPGRFSQGDYIVCK